MENDFEDLLELINRDLPASQSIATNTNIPNDIQDSVRSPTTPSFQEQEHFNGSSKKSTKRLRSKEKENPVEFALDVDLSELHVVLEAGAEATKKHTDMEGKGKNLIVDIETEGTSTQYAGGVLNRYWCKPGHEFIVKLRHPPIKKGGFIRFLVNYIVPTRREHAVRACEKPEHNIEERSPCVFQIRPSELVEVQYFKDETSGKFSVKVFPSDDATTTHMRAYLKCRNTCLAGDNKQDKEWYLITTLERNNEIMERCCTDVKVVERPKEEKLRKERQIKEGKGKGRKRKADSSMPLTPPNSTETGDQALGTPGNPYSIPCTAPCTPHSHGSPYSIPCTPQSLLNLPTPVPATSPFWCPPQPSSTSFNCPPSSSRTPFCFPSQLPCTSLICPPTPQSPRTSYSRSAQPPGTPPQASHSTPVPVYSMPLTPSNTEDEEFVTVEGILPQVESAHIVPLQVEQRIELIQCKSEMEREVIYLFHSWFANQNEDYQASFATFLQRDPSSPIQPLES